MVKPQLPMTAVVTPSAGEGDAQRVPGDLRVVVRVVVDDARHQREAVGVDRLRWPELPSDLGDSSVLHGEVAATGRRAEAVEQQRVADDEVVHARSVY